MFGLRVRQRVSLEEAAQHDVPAATVSADWRRGASARALRGISNAAFCYSVGGSLLAQLGVIYFAPLQAVFQTEALTPHDLLSIGALASTVLLLDTARKTLPGLALLHRVGLAHTAAAALPCLVVGGGEKGDKLMV